MTSRTEVHFTFLVELQRKQVHSDKNGLSDVITTEMRAFRNNQDKPIPTFFSLSVTDTIPSGPVCLLEQLKKIWCYSTAHLLDETSIGSLSWLILRNLTTEDDTTLYCSSRIALFQPTSPRFNILGIFAKFVKNNVNDDSLWWKEFTKVSKEFQLDEDEGQ
ncbi:Phosphatidylinositol 4-Phosphate 5-Kinase Type-1 Alpha [Manis pentadactyla]|nr:Phosphatidylinositol 4-Phosphate 5-Kinase Type-1 Alpha [Manis pentadactyla]